MSTDTAATLTRRKAISAAPFVAVPFLLNGVAEDTRRGLADRVHRVLVDDRTFGGAVILAIDGAPGLARGYGWADRERRKPFTSATVAQIGSLSKQFTGAALAELVADGRVDISKPLKGYLPEAAEPAGSATLRQLLTHTAGLTTYCGDDFERRTREELISYCAALPLTHQVGTYAYSNIGYSFLAAVVERVTGEPLEARLKERFFRPLRMEHTGYSFPPSASVPFVLAKGYPPDAPVAPPVSDELATLHGDYWNLFGNGGMQASPIDMHRWFRALDHDLRLTRVRAALEMPLGETGDNVHYSFGWNVTVDKKGAPVQFSHSGSDGAFLAYFRIRPREGTFLYFVSNIGSERGAATLKKVIGVLKTIEAA